MSAYFVKINLIYTESLVSINIKESSETTLYLLNPIIQTVIGWENRHLCEFTINTLRFTDSRLDDSDFGEITDVGTVLLEDIFPKTGATAIYLYDF